MAFTKVTKDMGIISALADEPNDAGGLTAAQLKAKFDEGGAALKTFLNDTHISELETDGAKNIGIEAITGITSTTVQGALQEINTKAAQSAAGVVSDASITTAKLADLAATTAKIGELAVTSGKIADSAVTTGKINDAAVTTAKINDGAVTTAKLAGACVTTDKIGQGAVTPSKLDLSGGLDVTGSIILTSGMGYGDSLPEDGEEGELFFLKV